MPRTLALPAGYKWARFFRLQFAVRQTAKNRIRLAQGRRQVGRPMPRLISIDFEDAYMVPREWDLSDASMFARGQSLPYFAVFLDGEYWALPDGGAPFSVVQGCLDAGKIFVLPMEGIAKW